HLHGIDLDAAARFLDLSDGDVAQADRANETVALQPREGAHARRERRPRIGRMKLIEIQAFDAERFAAALTRGDQVLRPAIRLPAAAGPRQPAFGRDAHARSIAAPGRERFRDETLVVAPLRLVPRVSVR